MLLYILISFLLWLAVAAPVAAACQTAARADASTIPAEDAELGPA